ncbi:MAG: GNAT family N-acetyltransferase [Clostridia bacterium]|nr:GNAT family N-acetyltransferase [Clostridia bacterium]
MRIRRFTESDAGDLFRLLSDERVMEYLEPVFDEKKTEAFLRSAGTCREPLIWAVEENGGFIGYVIQHGFDGDSLEIGWVLLPEYWGAGRASQLTETLIERAYSAGKEAVIECHPAQEATKHIAEKYGFGSEGLRGGCETYRLTLSNMLLPRLSDEYCVKRLNEDDVESVYSLSASNPLFYRYHPPFVTRESISEDMRALPPGKSMKDKLFIGYYTKSGLAAVMDLVLKYPDGETAFIGFFMVDAKLQGRGAGSGIIGECERALKGCGFKRIRLAVDRGNPQSGAFWRKNGFAPAGEEYPCGNGTVIVMEKKL